MADIIKHSANHFSENLETLVSQIKSIGDALQHIVQLLHVEDSMQRAFYAIEAMRGPWSVRELQRQTDTNYYARSGGSKKPELLSKKINGTAERPTFEQDVKSPYYFEFMGLSSNDAIDENDLEAAIVSHLKAFIMELGMGFCPRRRAEEVIDRRPLLQGRFGVLSSHFEMPLHRGTQSP